MAIYLIVAQPRHGKSQFVVKTAHELHEKNLQIQKRLDSGKADPEKDLVRKIYSDIEGHAEKTDYIELAPHDWRDVPNDSIVIMDEIHKRPEFCDHDGKLSQHPMIVDLTTHAHQNKDIYLITQDPERLNKGIRKLVEKMYLVKRPIQKPPFATIYEFERWLRDPWQAAASTRNKNYQDSYKFFYKDKWQKMYTSASAHTSISFKIQNKFWYALLAIAVLSYSSYYLFTKSGGDKLAMTAVNGLQGKKPEPTTSEKTTTATGEIKPLENLDVECRKGANVEKPECVKWFENLSKTNASAMGSERYYQVSYNPNKPFDNSDIQQSISYEVTAKPVFSGCLKKNGRYVAYTQQGTILNDVSQEDCRRLVEQGERPFNYFESSNNRTELASTATERSGVATQSNQPNLTSEELARFQLAKEQGLI